MSDVWLPRAPAHSKLSPTISWDKADNKTTFLITKLLCCDQTAVVERMDSSLPPPVGYYRIRQAPAVFVKVMASDLIEQQLFADEIASFLFKSDVNTNKLMPLSPYFSGDGKLGILTYPLVRGRFSGFTEGDMSLIGSEIGKMHKVLRSCPWKKEVEMKGMERAQILDELLSDIRTGILKAGVPEGVLKILKSADISDYKRLTSEAQVVHGDLNYGNIMIQQSSGKAIIFDFEDTITAWFNPYMELAFVIERFAITPDDEQSIRLSQALIYSYFHENKCENKTRFYLSSLLRGLSIKALLLLTKACVIGMSVSETEWDKFLFLYQQPQRRAELFDRISKLVPVL